MRLVAIDGPGGAGKSSFAERLAGAAGGAPIDHTDDFASADNPLNWWPRLLQQVIVPLKRGEAAHFQRYVWSAESLAEWQTIEPAPIVIIEGVSSGRSEWVGHLSISSGSKLPGGCASNVRSKETAYTHSTTGKFGWAKKTPILRTTRLAIAPTHKSTGRPERLSSARRTSV